MKKTTFFAVVCMMAVNLASADVIPDISMDFVTIGHASNAADADYGAVDYVYRIGKYEVTAAQWQTINTAAGIGNSGNWSDSQPVAGISWYDAAQFCNYLTSGDKYSGAYKFNTSGDFLGIDRASSILAYGTTYVIPTVDEWYKAAFFKPDASGYSLYANGTSTAPVAGVDANYKRAVNSPWNAGTGRREQNGTFDMMGNVWEWNESLVFGEYRGLCGGAFNSDYDSDVASSLPIYDSPLTEFENFGFRVVCVPEPASLVLLGLGGLALRYRKR